MKIKKTHIHLLLLSFFLLTHSSYAQTKISGHIPGAEGFHIRYTYPEDFISNKKVCLFDTIIDKNGNFSLSLDFDKTLFGKFELPYFYTQFILEPDKTYKIDFDSVQIHNIIRPFYQKEKLQYKIYQQEDFLDTKYKEFEKNYSDYIFNNFNSIYQKHQTKLIDSLEILLSKQLNKEDNFFLKHWLDYRIADTKLQLIHSDKDKRNLFKQTLKEKEILYSSPTYMKFFTNYFKDFFIHNRKFTERDLNYCINTIESFKALQDSIGKDTLLRNERIRELVTLINLKSLYQDKNFSKTGILNILEQMQKSKFKEHQFIAKNLLSELPQLSSGQKAADFTLPSIKSHKESIQLQDFAGKPTYIIFYNSHNINCVRQLDKLDELYQTHSQRINFLAISLDEEYSTAQKLYTIKQYAFPMAWNGWSWKLIDDFQIRSFPSFISLDKDGKIIRYPEYEVDEMNFDLE